MLLNQDQDLLADLSKAICSSFETEKQALLTFSLMGCMTVAVCDIRGAIIGSTNHLWCV